MPRRDVVLTGLVAFGAGVAVGANWGKLRKKIGPLLEQLGLQMADLGDFLSAAGMDDIIPEAMEAEPARRPRARRNAKAKADAFASPTARRNGSRRNGHSVPLTKVQPKRKAARRKPVIVAEEEAPLATGTFGN